MGKNSKEFFRNFLKVSLETVIPQTSLILGTNSGEFLENFRGISYMKWFSRTSSKILQRKSPRLENLGKFPTFVTWDLWFTTFQNLIWPIVCKDWLCPYISLFTLKRHGLQFLREMFYFLYIHRLRHVSNAVLVKLLSAQVQLVNYQCQSRTQSYKLQSQHIHELKTINAKPIGTIS